MGRRSEVVRALLGAALAALVLVVLSCGSGRGSRTDALRTPPPLEGEGGVGKAPSTSELATLKHHSDVDSDKRHPSYFDPDDAEIIDYGHAATASEVREVAAAVKRYYEAAVRHDGSSGCALTYPLYAQSMVENYSAKTGIRGVSCAALLELLFKREHEALAYELTHLRVLGLRVEGLRGYALVGPGPRRFQRYLFVHRSGAGWTIEALRASEMS